jgi:iron complex transport system permease protein
VVLLQVRLPRVLVALLVGAALGASGAALQGLFRNPLADPSLLGVSVCAALLAQVVIFLGLASALPVLIPLSATVGAGLATWILVRLVKKSGSGGLELILLGGVALAQVAGAASALLLSLAVTDWTRAQQLLRWMLGSLDGRTWMHVFWGLGPVTAGLLLLMREANSLDRLSLGEVTARSLGVDVERVQRRVILCTALLSGSSVAMGGVVGFVGLLVPHALRPLLGAGSSLLIMGSVLGGGLLVVLCDLLSRIVLAPAELQLGVITAALGAPWFALLLRSRFREVLS